MPSDDARDLEETMHESFVIGRLFAVRFPASITLKLLILRGTGNDSNGGVMRFSMSCI